MVDVLCVGHAAFDMTMSVLHQPKADEKMQAQALNLAGGGPTANAAVCIARLGGHASFCGYLGNDSFCEAHLRELEVEGVDTSLIVRGEHPTPLSMILAKPDGTRSVINFKANTPYLAGDAVNFQSAKPAAVLFDGHEPLLSIAMDTWARKRGIPTVLDAGSVHQGTRDLAMTVDYLVASAKFARRFCEAGSMQSALKLLSGLRNNVVITLGKDGLVWARNGKTGAMPAYDVEVVDSTGAGDAFHGAFALGLAKDMAWTDLLRFASAAGALACTQLGARRGLPDKEEMKSFPGL